MWSLFPQRVQILVLVTSTIIATLGLQAVIAWWSGAASHPVKLVSLVTTLIGSILVPMADRVWQPIWRWAPWLETLIFPDLNGVWEGTLTTTWKNPQTGESPRPISTLLQIEQRLWSTSVRLKTGESASFSTRCILEADRAAKRFRVWYSYDNRPKAEVSHRSARHEGVAWLEMDLDASRDRLVGQYYTDRKTNGDIDLRRARS